MSHLADIKLSGVKGKVNLASLLQVLLEDGAAWFNTPEESPAQDATAIMNTITAQPYCDLAVSAKHITIAGVTIPRVFANIETDGDHLALLLFFDLTDLQAALGSTSMETIRNWLKQLHNVFNFETYRLQIDNGNADEYYFDERGTGPLWTDQ